MFDFPEKLCTWVHIHVSAISWDRSRWTTPTGYMCLLSVGTLCQVVGICVHPSAAAAQRSVASSNLQRGTRGWEQTDEENTNIPRNHSCSLWSSVTSMLSLAADWIHQTKTANQPKCNDSPVRKEKHQTSDITVRYWECMLDTSRTLGDDVWLFFGSRAGFMVNKGNEHRTEKKKKLNWPAEPLSRGGSTFVWWQLCSKPRGWSRV